MARPRDSVLTKRGRDRMEKLFNPAVTLLENIVGDGSLEYNGCKLEDRRKTSQYIIDHNLGRAAFQIYGQIDLYKSELVFKAFLAGDPALLPEPDRALLVENIESVPGVVAEDILCDTEATEKVVFGGEPAGMGNTSGEHADQATQENDPCGTEPLDDL